MDTFKKLNLTFGWGAWLIATIVYLSTIEPTTSFWDCGEFIATAYKLQVGHPPGAPLFSMIARFFMLFSGPENAAMMVNIQSGLSSSFTILFLFWTITYFAKKIALKSGELTDGKIYAIMGSGLVGALAYTFSDSFWFSAVEGEVYAMSSLFTAIVFWAILKWESVADEKHNLRWIVLIAYLMGLSIGVHLLNLLAIPAIVFVYYFKKHEVTRNGFIKAGAAAILILGFVQYGIIPGLITGATIFERIFTNGMGMPFNTGFFIYIALLIGLIVFGLFYTQKKNKPIWNTAILCFTVIVLGYSSFAAIVIRSNANPPMDENNPENAFTLLSYLNREQYGDRPLFNGPSFNSPLDRQDPYDDGKPVYVKDEEVGKYVISNDGKNSVPQYDDRFKTLLPRMWNTEAPRVKQYKRWSKFKGKPIQTIDNSGKQTVINTPTFGENLRYLFSYQMDWMYFRYFMWNFSGRQNDTQGHGNVRDGNWITGIKFIDEIRLGNQDFLPESITENNANNKYYMFPLILGLIGLLFQFKKDKNNGLIVLLLFFFTGLAIVLYLNQYPLQPRERDYAYAASFYAFAIWIGLGVIAIADLIAQKANMKMGAIIASIACLGLVPGIMAAENWDDHSRADRYTGRDFAKNYLDSCAPNAILFTNGDNDTFPLWYVQEVEEYRTDVRVVNLSLLNTDWYIEQVRRKAYDSDALPLSISQKKYRQGTNDYLPVVDRKELSGYTDVEKVIDFVLSDNPQTKVPVGSGESINFVPTKRLRVKVNKEKLLKDGTIKPEDADKMVDYIEWSVKGSYILKNDLAVLDLLATSDWDRPIYFASTTGPDSYIGLENYFRQEGMAYRLVPIKAERGQDGNPGFVDSDILYTNVMEKFQWGGMDKNDIYMDETNRRMTMSLRILFNRLATQLIEEKDNEKAKEVMDKAFEVMPDKTVPYDIFAMFLVENYYRLGEFEKANVITARIVDIFSKDVAYYNSLKPELQAAFRNDQQQAMGVLQRLYQMVSQQYPQSPEFQKEIENKIAPYFNTGIRQQDR